MIKTPLKKTLLDKKKNLNENSVSYIVFLNLDQYTFMYNEVDCGIHPYKDNFVGLDSTAAITYEDMQLSH